MKKKKKKSQQCKRAQRIKKTLFFFIFTTTPIMQGMEIDAKMQAELHDYVLQQSKNEQNVEGMRNISKEMADELEHIPPGTIIENWRYSLVLHQASKGVQKLRENPLFKNALFTAVARSYLVELYQTNESSAAQQSWDSFYTIVKEYLTDTVWSDKRINGSHINDKAAVIIQFKYRKMKNDHIAIIGK